MFRSIYKEAYDEIIPNEKLIKDILDGKCKRKAFNRAFVYAAAVLIVAVGIGVVPKLNTGEKATGMESNNTRRMEAYSSDVKETATVAESNKSLSAEAYPSNIEDKASDEESKQAEAAKGDFLWLINVPDGFSITNHDGYYIIGSESDDRSVKIYESNDSKAEELCNTDESDIQFKFSADGKKYTVTSQGFTDKELFNMFSSFEIN